MDTPNVMTVNVGSIGIKWRHIGMLTTLIITLATSGAAAGWLVLPAKSTDLQALKQTVQIVSDDLKSTQRTTQELITAVTELTKTVKTLQQTTGRVKPR